MQLRFGVVGTGFWASEVHAVVLAEHPDVELVGIWGRDPAKTSAAAGRLGVRPFATFDQLLEEVQAVSIAVPPSVQPGFAVRAATAGRHLLLEKPLAASLEAARQVRDAVTGAGVASVVCFSHRFTPAVQQWLTAQQARTWTAARYRWRTGLLTSGGPYASSPWRRAPGGALWDIGPHALSVLLPLLGAVAEVSAADDGETTTATLRHQGGAASELLLSHGGGPEQVVRECVLTGPDGRTTLPDAQAPRTGVIGGAIDGLVTLARAGGGDHECGVRLGLEVVAVLDAVARSATAAGAPIRPINNGT